MTGKLDVEQLARDMSPNGWVNDPAFTYVVRPNVPTEALTNLLRELLVGRRVAPGLRERWRETLNMRVRNGTLDTNILMTAIDELYDDINEHDSWEKHHASVQVLVEETYERMNSLYKIVTEQDAMVIDHVRMKLDAHVDDGTLTVNALHELNNILNTISELYLLIDTRRGDKHV